MLRQDTDEDPLATLVLLGGLIVKRKEKLLATDVVEEECLDELDASDARRAIAADDELITT